MTIGLSCDGLLRQCSPGILIYFRMHLLFIQQGVGYGNLLALSLLKKPVGQVAQALLTQNTHLQGASK